MAKINQIQNALKELDGGAFQKLADSYLLKKGYLQIISLSEIVVYSANTYFPSFVGIKVSGVPFLTLLLPATDPREII
jgi:hypothetical protein